MAWNETTQVKYRRTDDHWQDNLTDEEWLLIEPMIPKQGRMGRPRKTDPARSLMRSSTCWGIVTLLNSRTVIWHRTQTHAAAVTVCHRSIAWLRNWRNVLREIRWRWTLKVL